jgi:hypothetical protein
MYFYLPGILYFRYCKKENMESNRTKQIIIIAAIISALAVSALAAGYIIKLVMDDGTVPAGQTSTKPQVVAEADTLQLLPKATGIVLAVICGL